MASDPPRVIVLAGPNGAGKTTAAPRVLGQTLATMSGNGKKSIEQVFREGTPIDDAAREAVQDALWRHKQAGNPICVWRDGQVVWIPPEEIPVERPPSTPAAADPLAGEGL